MKEYTLKKVSIIPMRGDYYGNYYEYSYWNNFNVFFYMFSIYRWVVYLHS